MTEIAQDEVTKQLLALEEALLDPTLRRTPAQMDALLAADFMEIGSSGRVWSRAETLDLLAHEEGYTEPPLVRDFVCRPLALGVVLATYRAIRMDKSSGKPRETLRSSIWSTVAHGWQMRFHQGTSAT
ncbi:MAG: DUF4440 domain-containing protein [Terracidiphilus sp.]